MFYVLASVLSVVVLFGVTMVLKEEEPLCQEEILITLSSYIDEFARSEKEELRKLASNLSTIRSKIQKETVDPISITNLLHEVQAVKLSASSLRHFAKEDKRLVKQNLKEYTRLLNQKIRVMS